MNASPKILHSLKSTHLGNERSIWVRPPRDPSAACHLAIFLDGELYREKVGAPALIEELEAASAIGNTLFVFVSVCTWEARWIECPCHPPFAHFIAEELLPWLAHTYPQFVTSRGRTLIGLSYTGLAAAFAAFQSPGAFTHVIAQSGSFWWHDCWLVDQFRLRPAPLRTAFYLDVGTKETATHVRHKEDVLQVVSQLDAIRRLRIVLTDQRYDLRYHEFDGGHDATYWKKNLPAALRWALPNPF